MKLVSQSNSAKCQPNFLECRVCGHNPTLGLGDSASGGELHTSMMIRPRSWLHHSSILNRAGAFGFSPSLGCT